MKRKTFNKFLFTLGLVVLFTACNSDDDGNNSNNNAQEIARIESIAETGTWRITSYIDSGINETSDFNGYNFTFVNTGSLTASNGITVYTGSWSITDSSNSNDDSNSDNDIDFNISFSVPDTNDFDDLNDDWDVVSVSETTISLIDVSGGNGGTDTLIFEKN